MNDDLAAKLRLTAAALGCATRKELCARFRAVNPRTHCELDRLNKWMQGQARPRSMQFYADWLAVLGSRRSTAWLTNCPLEEFRREISAVTGQPAEDLPSGPRPGPRPAAAGATLLGGSRALCGLYACYSFAWSPHYRGRLVRGALRLSAGRGAGLQATYSEVLIGRRVCMHGEVLVANRTLHIAAYEEDGHLPLFFSLVLPGPPFSAMCGVMSGPALVAQEALPSTSRVLLVRVPASCDLEASNRYMGAAPAEIAAELAALGVLRPEKSAMLPLLTAWFADGAMDQVSAADQAAFARILDLAHIERGAAAAE